MVQAARLKLGKGVQAFRTGRDGGRDARFEGLADGFPSLARAWEGITIVQAKHTNSSGHFSDADFSGPGKGSVLCKELPRARKLREAGKLHNYLIYSNRFLTAGTNERLLEEIAAAIGIGTENVHLCGIEALDEALREKPGLDTLAGIDPLDGPLIVTSRELAEVVEAVAKHVKDAGAGSQSKPVKRTSLAKKDELNSMTPAMSGRLMRNYGPLLGQIKEFLADPMNERICAIYDDCAEDFDLKIVANRKDDQTFDKVYDYLVKMLTSRDTVLGRNRALTRAVVFYMYWNCDIGDTEEDHVALP